MNKQDKVFQLRTELKQLYYLESCMSILGYDQQVFMPAAAADSRSDQLEYLSGLHHQKISSDSFWHLVEDLNQDIKEFNQDEQVIIRETYRTVSRSRKLPVSFVAEKTKICSETYSSWAKIMLDKNSDQEAGWQRLRPKLSRIVELAKEEAELRGYEQSAYDALLDSFEPYARLSQIKPLLLELGQRLKKVLPELTDRYAGFKAIDGYFPIDKQEQFCRAVLSKLGFDFNCGRLDTAAHPFMSKLGASDLRVTTRYRTENFMPALFGAIHEFGHALYEAGLPDEFIGTPKATAVSMAIHESQSRLWENIVARSKEFSVYLSDLAVNFFETNVNSEDLYFLANIVKPSLIRVEADELSYSLHIVIRMLLEEELVSGSLAVDQLPERWNNLYEEYLGIRSATLKKGILQDIHWFSGAIGYFPSYALGNLYAAMFLESFEEKHGTLGSLIESDQLLLLNSWLKENIYRHGQTYTATELAENVCGKKLSIEPFLEYLSKKHGTRI